MWSIFDLPWSSSSVVSFKIKFEEICYDGNVALHKMGNCVTLDSEVLIPDANKLEEQKIPFKYSHYFMSFPS